MVNYNNNNLNSQLQFMDLLNIASFCLGIMNLNQNLTQNDKQELEEELNKKINSLLEEIHSHLTAQDEKINRILALMEAKNSDS